MNIIIFDTETIGKVSQDLLNVGYKIIDLNIQNATYKTLVERDYVVTDLINNEIYCLNDDFVGAAKYVKYLDAIRKKETIKRNLPQIFKTLENDLKRHNVLFGYAFNSQFDLDKFEKSAKKFGVDNPLASLPVFDIWNYAHEYICNTSDYKTWACNNNILTATEVYIQQSVEAICKYLYGDLDFVEEHTALSDVHHETAILVGCVVRGCDITRPGKNHKLIKSDKLFNQIVVLPNGTEIDFTYTSKYERNGKTIYKR